MEQPGTATDSSSIIHKCQYVVFLQKLQLSAPFKKSSKFFCIFLIKFYHMW